MITGKIKIRIQGSTKFSTMLATKIAWTLNSAYRWMRAEPPFESALTWSSVAIVVSPG